MTTRGNISSAMTRFFGQAAPFSTQRAKLTRVFSDIKGTHYLQPVDFSIEFSSGFWCSSFCAAQTHARFFRRFRFLPNASSYSRLGFGSSNCLFRASSAFKLFEAGSRSLELSFLGQQCLQVIRGWASVPRIVFFGPAVPSSYSRLGFGPSNCLFRASSAFKLFEAGSRSLELSSSAQPGLQSVLV
jgi:hypothetical protein